MAADYVRSIAEAIHYAHQRGILHCDLKPSNVLIDAQDHPRLTDSGLAKRLTDSQLSTQNSELTLTGQVLGTPSYMSPEQAQGRRIADLPRDADFTRWLEWFFADRSTRTLSPYSPIPIPQYVQSRAEETNVMSWREALMLCPTNGLAFARMARHCLRQSQSTNSSDFAQADWASRQAVKFAPRDGDAWHVRRLVLEQTRRWNELLTEADQAIQVQSANAFAWNAKAEALLEMGQPEAAMDACNRALETWAADKIFFWGADLERDILLKRSSALQRLGR
jgi:tetratricopeptide (TPR) repeat protein